MANKPATEDAPAQDFKAHEHDYLEFIRLIKYGAITALLVGLFVILIL